MELLHYQNFESKGDLQNEKLDLLFLLFDKSKIENKTSHGMPQSGYKKSIQAFLGVQNKNHKQNGVSFNKLDSWEHSIYTELFRVCLTCSSFNSLLSSAIKSIKR